MGNSIARDFQKVELGQGSVPQLKQELLAPGSMLLKSAMTVLIRKDHTRKSSIVFDQESMLPLYVTKPCKKTASAITKEPSGRVLFLTTAPNRTKRLIYKAPNNLPQHNHGWDSCSLSSAKSSSSSSSHEMLPCTAQIEIDYSASAVQAFLSIVVWGGNGPELSQVYKAVKIPQVKHGALVVDNLGQVVGKSCLDEIRMEPKVQIASGADVPAVVALISALFGDF